MGIIYRANCRECDYSEQFHLGGGLQSIDLSWSIQALDEGEQAKIRKMEEEGKIADFSVEKKLVQCRYCNLLKPLKNKMIIKITDKMYYVHVFGNHCSDCGKELQIYDGIERDTQKVMCPKCRKAFLIFRQAGRWD